MKRVISFSLWGSLPKYTVGAIRNAELAGTIYRGWTPRFYVARSVPRRVLHKLRDLGSEIVPAKEEGYRGLFWRFLAAADPGVDVMISRDTDSRLGAREKAAVDAWLGSGKRFHIMRDHPWHKTAILGGMWGVRKPLLANMDTLLDRQSRGDYWQADQEFLSQTIHKLVRKDCVIHDEFFDRLPFPTRRNGYEFVGESFDEHGGRDPEALQALHEYFGARMLDKLKKQRRIRLT